MVYGRYADLFLDPVLNDANVDIWILSNLYDTDFRNMTWPVPGSAILRGKSGIFAIIK